MELLQDEVIYGAVNESEFILHALIGTVLCNNQPQRYKKSTRFLTMQILIQGLDSLEGAISSRTYFIKNMNRDQA